MSVPGMSGSGADELVRGSIKDSALAGVIKIFRKRWPEAAMVILLQAGLMILLEEIAGRASVAAHGIYLGNGHGAFCNHLADALSRFSGYCLP